MRGASRGVRSRAGAAPAARLAHAPGRPRFTVRRHNDRLPSMAGRGGERRRGNAPGGTALTGRIRTSARKFGTGDLRRTPQRSAESRPGPDRKGAGTWVSQARVGHASPACPGGSRKTSAVLGAPPLAFFRAKFQTDGVPGADTNNTGDDARLVSFRGASDSERTRNLITEALKTYDPEPDYPDRVALDSEPAPLMRPGMTAGVTPPPPVSGPSPALSGWSRCPPRCLSRRRHPRCRRRR